MWTESRPFNGDEMHWFPGAEDFPDGKPLISYHEEASINCDAHGIWLNADGESWVIYREVESQESAGIILAIFTALDLPTLINRFKEKGECCD